jgi:hypothetical protein
MQCWDPAGSGAALLQVLEAQMPFKLRRRLEQRQGPQQPGGGAAQGLPPPTRPGDAAGSGGLVPLPAGTGAAGEGSSGSGTSGPLGAAEEKRPPSRPGSPSQDGPGLKPLNSVERTIRMRQIELSMRLRAQEKQQQVRQQQAQQAQQMRQQQVRQEQQQQARLAGRQPQQLAQVQAQAQLRQQLQQPPQPALGAAAAALPAQQGLPRRRKSSAAMALASRPAYLLQASARQLQHPAILAHCLAPPKRAARCTKNPRGTKAMAASNGCHQSTEQGHRWLMATCMPLQDRGRLPSSWQYVGVDGGRLATLQQLQADYPYLDVGQLLQRPQSPAGGRQEGEALQEEPAQRVRCAPPGRVPSLQCSVHGPSCT